MSQGFGKRLMYGCEAFAAELGLRKMSASVDSSQKRLLSFYLSMGGVIESNGAAEIAMSECQWTKSYIPIMDPADSTGS